MERYASESASTKRRISSRCCWRRSARSCWACQRRKNTAKPSAGRRCADGLRARRPARTMRTILRLVVPRTMESSTRITRLPSSRMPNGIQFEFDAEIANGLRRFDKRASHVVVTDESLTIGKSGFGGVTEGGGDTRVGNGTTMSASAGARERASGPAFRGIPGRDGRRRWNRAARNRRARRRIAKAGCCGA